MVSVSRLLLSSLTLGAALVTSRAVSDDKQKQPDPPAITKDVTENAKKPFNKDEIKPLIRKIGSDVYLTRDKASKELLKIADGFSFEEPDNFLTYILKERASSTDLEVTRRLDDVVKRATESIIKSAAEEVKTPKRNDALAKVIKSMEQNRTPEIWRTLLPVTADLITQEATINNRYTYDYGHYNRGPLKLDPQAIESVSNLLISTKSDSKKLQEIALSQAAAWTKAPFQQWNPIKALNKSKLEQLAKLPEANLKDIEPGLKDLKIVYPLLDQSCTPGVTLGPSSKQALGELLDLNVTALSSNDSEKQKLALANIKAISEHLDCPNIQDRPSTSVGSKIFQRAELSKNDLRLTELQSAVNLIQSIAPFSRTDSEYHKLYVNWLERAFNSMPKADTERKVAKELLVSALKEELYTVAQSGKRTPLQADMIKILTPVYAKHINQTETNPELIKENIDNLMELRDFAFHYLNPAAQEEFHPQLLTMFDSLVENINKVQKKEDRATLRIQLLMTVPRAISHLPSSVESATGEKQSNMKAANKLLEQTAKDYLPRLSKLYREQDSAEFATLMPALVSIDTQWGQWSQSALQPELMIQYLRKDFDNFATKTDEIIKAYNNSNDPAVKASLKGHLQRVDSSFQLLFNEGKKSGNGWIGQGLCVTRVSENKFVNNWAEAGWIHLDPRSDLKTQIAEIRDLYQQRLQEPIDKILADPKQVENP